MRIPIGSCSVEVPETWKDRTVHTFVAPKVVDPRMTPHLRMGSGFRENISISRERVKRGSTPETYIHKQMDELKTRLLGFRLLYEEPQHVGGYLAHCASYQFTLRGEGLEICQFRAAVLIDQEMVNFTGTAAANVYEAKRHIFLNILQSLHVPTATHY